MLIHTETPNIVRLFRIKSPRQSGKINTFAYYI